jgi:hypothetical protein
MKWWVQFNNLTYVQAVIEVPNSSIFYGCGDWDANNAAASIPQAYYEAAIFKMD